jgi:hypothetical protein
MQECLFTDFSFAVTIATSFIDSHTPFAISMKKDSAPVRVADPFEKLNRSFRYFQKGNGGRFDTDTLAEN